MTLRMVYLSPDEPHEADYSGSRRAALTIVCDVDRYGGVRGSMSGADLGRA